MSGLGLSGRKPLVLVTGATGFVGRTVLPRLLESGYRVRAALRRPAPLPAGIGAVTVGELGSATDWRPALAGVDLVVHLAARVHVMGEATGKAGADAAGHYHRTNVEGTRRLAEAAVAAGVRRFLLMSSVKALGEGAAGTRRREPLTETTPPAPTDPYGRSKLEAEAALRQAAGAVMGWVVLRPPLVYGPGVGANFLKLLRLSRSGLPLPLAALDNRRSLVFVGNLADAACTALSHPGAANRAFLVHDGPALTVPELIRRLARHFGRPARLFPVPQAALRLAAAGLGARDAFERLCGSLEVDDSALRHATGWVAPVGVDDGLAATVAWYLGTSPHRR
jgi:nucleoside-diphosphate-sugar epimerase